MHEKYHLIPVERIELAIQGYDLAHEEWLRQGAYEFRKRFQIGAPKQFYSTPYWKLVRQATLNRDCFKCFRCSNPASQVHHLHYDFMGEDHLHPEVLVSICHNCHGVVEYGRNAEALVPVIRRRIYACQGFIDGRRGFEDENPVKVLSRLLEYRDKLAELKRLYEAQIPYNQFVQSHAAESSAKAPDLWSTPLSRHNKQIQNQKVRVAEIQLADAEYHQLAENETTSWKGSEKEKAARIIPLLEREIQYCREFARQVVQPLT